MKSKLPAIFYAPVLFLLLWAGCSSSDLKADIFAAGNYLQAPARISELLEEKNSTMQITVLDVRTPEEFTAACLNKAININYRSPSFAADVAKLDTKGTYLVYCRTGRRSAEAVSVMRKAGFDKIIELEGGITAWQAAGLPVETDCG